MTHCRSISGFNSIETNLNLIFSDFVIRKLNLFTFLKVYS